MTPGYSDKFRFSYIDLLMPVVVASLLIQGLFGGGAVALIFGFGGTAYLLLTRHIRYDLYDDAFVVRFIAPRRVVVYLKEIEEVLPVTTPITGAGLLIRRKNGTRLFVRPSDPEGMMSRLRARMPDGPSGE